MPCFVPPPPTFPSNCRVGAKVQEKGRREGVRDTLTADTHLQQFLELIVLVRRWAKQDFYPCSAFCGSRAKRRQPALCLDLQDCQSH